MRRFVVLVAVALALAAARARPRQVESSFALIPEWKGELSRSDVVDVNLGHTPESFVNAACLQITGQGATKELLTYWCGRLRSDPRLRRVDVVRTIARQVGRNPKLTYSSPWTSNPDLPPAGRKRNIRRELGAVVMFFFHCPDGVNCKLDWAGSHAWGMDRQSAGLGFGASPQGYYDPNNPGFWKRELRDARAAGLQFILPNVYGPDIGEGRIATLRAALEAEADPVKLGMFDDTWPWGEKWFGPFWQAGPNLADSEGAAAKLYNAKWKPYFSEIPRKHWYLVRGKPLIYFYNAGKLQPRRESAAVLARMKAMFLRDFGVEPFLAVDRAFWEDPRMGDVADAKFIWDSFQVPGGVSRFEIKGRTLCHAMPRWDAVGRDRPGELPSPSDRLLKGPEKLEEILGATEDADLLVLATWNDLGEGTGVNRNYDYYYLGRWLTPDHFIQMLRRAQTL